MSVVRIFEPLSVALWAALALVVAPSVSAHPPGVTERVSVGPGGGAGANDSQLPAVTGDGRYDAFWS